MTTDDERRYAICLRNEGAADLELRKLYEVVPDESASRHGQLRVIDESGGDYLYPAGFFALIDIPREARDALTELLVPSPR